MKFGLENSIKVATEHLTEFFQVSKRFGALHWLPFRHRLSIRGEKWQTRPNTLRRINNIII